MKKHDFILKTLADFLISFILFITIIVIPFVLPFLVFMFTSDI